MIQDLIHNFEEGAGARLARGLLILLALALLLVGYNWRAFKNMAGQEAMDAAQLARNLAEGRGYTTRFIRPFSMHLVKRNKPAADQVALLADQDVYAIKGDAAKGGHPDLAQAPVYPLTLAALMKVLPFRYSIPEKPRPWWNDGARFWRYQPDFLIAVFNQLVLLASVVLFYGLAKRLLDPKAALVAAALMLGTDLLWRFSVSGLSTNLLILIFVCLARVLVAFEASLQAGAPSSNARRHVLAAAAGVLVGLGGLTRYSFLWVALPVLGFVLLLGGAKRLGFAAVVAVAIAITVGPWGWRNVSWTGAPFGTASYALIENTREFPGDRLQRSLEPKLRGVVLGAFWEKLTTNARPLVLTELPRMGGTWLTALFAAGLLTGLAPLQAGRFRYFVLGALAVLALGQVLGKTQLSEDVPEINGENLLALLTPFVILYGVGFFWSVYEKLPAAWLEVRPFILGAFLFLGTLPLWLSFAPPRTIPVAYPPYYPPAIQNLSKWVEPNDLTMSDIPWAVAWYANRQSLWLTLTPGGELFDINDYQKQIRLLYLSPVTLGKPFNTEFLTGPDRTWGGLVTDTYLRGAPRNFPLKHMAPAPRGDSFILADVERWNLKPRPAE